MFSPTVSSSSSIPFKFFSASSALSSPLFRFLKLFHVLTNCLKFFFDTLQVLLSKLGSLKSSLQLRFLDSELPAEFIKLLLIVNGHLDCGSQILVELFKG